MMDSPHSCCYYLSFYTDTLICCVQVSAHCLQKIITGVFLHTGYILGPMIMKFFHSSTLLRIVATYEAKLCNFYVLSQHFILETVDKMSRSCSFLPHTQLASLINDNKICKKVAPPQFGISCQVILFLVMAGEL